MGSLENIIKESNNEEIEKKKHSMEIEQPINPQESIIEENSHPNTVFYKKYSNSLANLNLAEFSTPKAINLFSQMITRLVEGIYQIFYFTHELSLEREGE